MKLFESLKATVFKNATNEELLALVIVANEYSLNPFLKELYAFPAKGGGIVPIVSVDGWNKMLVRQPDFDGIKFTDNVDQQGNLVSCTATIFVKGRSHPCEVTEYLDECKRNTDPWNNMPHRMLRNRTLCQASRIAFGFSGVKHEEEVAGAVDVEAIVMPPQPERQGTEQEVKQAEKQLEPPPREKKLTPQDELEAFVVSEGYTFANLVVWAKDSGNIPDADSLPGFSDVPTDVCKRLLRAKAGLLKGLAMTKVDTGAEGVTP